MIPFANAFGPADWFPEEWAPVFHATKGAVALIGTLLLLVHMNRTWPTVKTWGRRLRYLTLLYGSCLVTYASAEQMAVEAMVDNRALFGAGYAVLLLLAATLSLSTGRHDFSD